MTRIVVLRRDGDRMVADSWFDGDKADLIDEDTRWDGHNRVSVHTTDHAAHEQLYRTAAGRWVLCRWSQRQTVPTTYEQISDDQARNWLVVNGSDDIIAKYLDTVEEERGPGRPTLGGDKPSDPVNVRLSPDLLTRVDRYADKHATSRAAAIRDLITKALGQD